MAIGDKISKLGLQLTSVFLAGQILVIFSSWRFLPAKLPLFYSRPWGEEQLVNPLGLWLIPIFSLIIFLANLVCVLLATDQESLVKQILALATAIFSLLGLISLIQIIRLVI